MKGPRNGLRPLFCPQTHPPTPGRLQLGGEKKKNVENIRRAKWRAIKIIAKFEIQVGACGTLKVAPLLATPPSLQASRPYSTLGKQWWTVKQNVHCSVKSANRGFLFFHFSLGLCVFSRFTICFATHVKYKVICGNLMFIVNCFLFAQCHHFAVCQQRKLTHTRRLTSNTHTGTHWWSELPSSQKIKFHKNWVLKLRNNLIHFLKSKQKSVKCNDC